MKTVPYFWISDLVPFLTKSHVPGGWQLASKRKKLENLESADEGDERQVSEVSKESGEGQRAKISNQTKKGTTGKLKKYTFSTLDAHCLVGLKFLPEAIPLALVSKIECVCSVTLFFYFLCVPTSNSADFDWMSINQVIRILGDHLWSRSKLL